VEPKARPALSIVIPTYNEERYLPLLLSSLRTQTYTSYEVIVADAHSKDKTRNIAKKAGCRVVDGGLSGVGRNRGAAIAKGRIILFLDADVVLGDDFLERNIAAFTKRRLVCATAWNVPISGNVIDKFLFFSLNVSLKAIGLFRSRAPGYCIFVTRTVFKRIHGFDEMLRVSEDADFCERTRKYGEFSVLMGSPVYVSVRRLKEEGRFAYTFKILKIAYYDCVGRRITDESGVQYDFSGHR
jgi:glycosyltransferase involved in cell wall biosynthesis